MTSILAPFASAPGGDAPLFHKPSVLPNQPFLRTPRGKGLGAARSNARRRFRAFARFVGLFLLPLERPRRRLHERWAPSEAYFFFSSLAGVEAGAAAAPSAGAAASAAAASFSSERSADGAAIVATVKSRSRIFGVTPSGRLMAEI